jgi:N6-L-threonylcarbamoyladenine synthase
MRILAIETSCDETGLAIFSFDKGSKELRLESNVLFSQIAIHEQFGGVFPALAKRAHAERFVPLLEEALKNAGHYTAHTEAVSAELKAKILDACPREEMLVEAICAFAETIAKPDIDCIAVTIGPGLEPALWVGINAAKALSMLWNIPILPINHMEGHVVTALFERMESSNTFVQKDVQFPLMALLVSGGHTELVVVNGFDDYTKIGATRDDAVGEAFDKVARMIELPYPGGPAVSKLAAEFRKKIKEQNIENPFTLPRPMLHSQDYDFSFSGIKTATLYTIRDLGRALSDDDKMALAAAFEDAVIEVLIKKTRKATEEFHTPTIVVGGGVAGNTLLREQLTKTFSARSDLAERLMSFFPKRGLPPTTPS